MLTFLNFPARPSLTTLDADFAILGIPFCQPYGEEEPANDQHNAPAAIRRESGRLSLGLDRWDFDINATLADFRVADCGDLPPAGWDASGRAEQTVRAILERGAIPVILGGDHGVPIPVLRAFSNHPPLTVVQVDAHLDWRDERNGVREGYSSPMRRASEMTHVGEIFQIGIRAQGSAGADEVRAARAYGAHLITAYEVHAHGMAHVLANIPDGGHYYLTIDADGFDPSVMPAVAGPAAGGLWFHQVRDLICGLSQKGTLAGMDIVEITPSRDVNGISAITAGQLILNFIGHAQLGMAN